jgi:hypothetical protein
MPSCHSAACPTSQATILVEPSGGTRLDEPAQKSGQAASTEVIEVRPPGSDCDAGHLLNAGLVDRFRVVVFPVITGTSGRERIYDGYPDVALDMISSRTFDGRIQLVEYIPTILVGPPWHQQGERLSGRSRRTDRSVQIAGISNAFRSTITLAERSEDVTEVTIRALFNTQAQRDEVIERYGADERGCETLGRLAAYVESRRRR